MARDAAAAGGRLQVRGAAGCGGPEERGGAGAGAAGTDVEAEDGRPVGERRAGSAAGAGAPAAAARAESESRTDRTAPAARWRDVPDARAQLEDRTNRAVRQQAAATAPPPAGKAAAARKKAARTRKKNTKVAQKKKKKKKKKKTAAAIAPDAQTEAASEAVAELPPQIVLHEVSVGRLGSSGLGRRKQTRPSPVKEQPEEEEESSSESESSSSDSESSGSGSDGGSSSEDNGAGIGGGDSRLQQREDYSDLQRQFLSVEASLPQAEREVLAADLENIAGTISDMSLKQTRTVDRPADAGVSGGRRRAEDDGVPKEGHGGAGGIASIDGADDGDESSQASWSGSEDEDDYGDDDREELHAGRGRGGGGGGVGGAGEWKLHTDAASGEQFQIHSVTQEVRWLGGDADGGDSHSEELPRQRQRQRQQRRHSSRSSPPPNNHSKHKAASGSRREARNSKRSPSAGATAAHGQKAKAARGGTKTFFGILFV